jgi:hypothetical protein
LTTTHQDDAKKMDVLYSDQDRSTATREPVSIVCVFNAPEVRQDCLDRSIEALRAEREDVDYIPIDNTTSTFGSAGSALNHGVRLARHEYVVFVHQDVYLHSLTALEVAAGLLATDSGLGVLGACGVDAQGALVGCIRDRTCLLGDSIAIAREVDSLDEVLFMAPKRLLLEHPLVEDPEFAWHAYAVPLPLTHNSLTTNLARLAEAHAMIARKYPDRLPVRTTCGVVTAETPRAIGRQPFLASQRWRYRWLAATPRAYAVRRAAGGGTVVLTDIRFTIDDVIRAVPGPFRIFNLDPDDGFPEGHGPVELRRWDKPVVFSAGDLQALASEIARRPPGVPLLVTGLTLDDLSSVVCLTGSDDRIVGVHEVVGCWVLLGCPPDAVPSSWRGAAATPVGMRSLGS